MIIEYKTSDKWGPFTAPRANRYILHNDASNPTISSLESFDLQLADFNPRLLVISGLQMMDNFPYMTGEREARLKKVKQQIVARSRSTTLIHFEMASYVEMELVQQLFEHIVPYVDSIGMNEQELDNLQQTLDGGSVSYATESNPRVATTLDKMRQVLRRLVANYNHKVDVDVERRRCSRLHVHTLAFQAIMVFDEETPRKWKNTKNAAAKAALTAHRHVCGSSIVNPDSSHLILDDSFMTSAVEFASEQQPKRVHFEDWDPVACWTEHLTENNWQYLWTVPMHVCVAPVLVCKVARQTAGAGDNISAAGLILQI